MKIKTNNHNRELQSFQALPESEHAMFDYIKDDERYSNRLFNYLGEWYDVGEFVRIVSQSKAVGFQHGTDDPALLQWDGIQTDSYYTAVVVRYIDDEYVIAGSLEI